ncbi:hypothetical protein ACWFRJ_04220 [Streptomyces sp. NPDC055239]
MEACSVLGDEAIATYERAAAELPCGGHALGADLDQPRKLNRT